MMRHWILLSASPYQVLWWFLAIDHLVFGYATTDEFLHWKESKVTRWQFGIQEDSKDISVSGPRARKDRDASLHTCQSTVARLWRDNVLKGRSPGCFETSRHHCHCNKKKNSTIGLQIVSHRNLSDSPHSFQMIWIILDIRHVESVREIVAHKSLWRQGMEFYFRKVLDSQHFNRVVILYAMLTKGRRICSEVPLDDPYVGNLKNR